MKTFEYVIKDENGIHARPAGLLVKTAADFRCGVKIIANGKAADAKRIFSVMGLGVKQGQSITVETEGEDEEKAAEAMRKFLNENM